MPEPSIAVVVPVHADRPELHACLDALARSADSPDETVIVIDGHDDHLEQVLSPHASRLLGLPRSRGPAAARNAGARAATSDLVLFLDADVAVHADTVGRARRSLGEDPAVDAVIGSYDDSPAAENLLSRYKNLLNHWMHQHAEPEAETFWGACGAIRRDVFLALGGFDATTYPHPSVEDIELGYRLTARGGRIRVDPELQVTHLKRWRAHSLLQADVGRRAVPWAELLLARGRFQDDLNVDARARVKVAAATLTVLALGGEALDRGPRGIGTTGAAGGVAVLAWLDRGLIAFWSRRCGARFAVAATAWHWFSYLYSAAGFVVALVRHLTGTSRAPGALRPG